MSKAVGIFLIVAFNVAPIIGVLFFGWQPFEAFWFFWLETLIMAVFNTIRIVFSQHIGSTGVLPGLPKKYHAAKAMKYLLIRIGIFFFYSLFIIIFMGFIANTHGDKVEVVRTLVFQNRFFNVGLLISMVSQGYYLVFYFFRNGTYLKADPDSYAAIFDSRQIVMHIAIVLGTFATVFLEKNTSFGTYGGTAMISIFCICKCVAELYNYNTEAP